MLNGYVRYLRRMLYPGIGAIFCLVYTLASLLIPQPPEPCALCTDTGRVYSYPCLVKLETGQVGEIRVEDMGREYLDENSQFREAGTHTTFSFLLDCLATNATDAGKSVTSVELSRATIVLSPKLFCGDCFKKISKLKLSGGYILADLYDPEDVRVYSIAAGAEYDIRGCAVEVTKANSGLTVTVTGYFE